MIIHEDSGKRYTPTEAAKTLIESAAYFPVENDEIHPFDRERITASEEEALRAALIKQYLRVRKLLGRIAPR